MQQSPQFNKNLLKKIDLEPGATGISLMQIACKAPYSSKCAAFSRLPWGGYLTFILKQQNSPFYLGLMGLRGGVLKWIPISLSSFLL